MARRVKRFVVFLAALAAYLALRPRGAIRLLTGGDRDDHGMLFYIATDRPVVALTLDDGPDAAATPAILDVLRRHGARATFFLITGHIPGNEDVVRRLVAEGHELGNHMAADRPSSRLPLERFRAELREAHAALGAFAPVVHWFRPGAGLATPAQLDAARALGYRPVLGDVYPLDAHAAWVPWIRFYVAGAVRPGSIIILHDRGARGRRTARALEHLLPTLAARGLRVVTLGELVGEPAAGGER